MKPLTPASPHAIIMVGIPGSGKSTFAEHFADTFQAPIVSQTKLKNDFSLTADAAETLRSLILGEYLKTHRTVLIDGGTERKTKRAELIRTLAGAGYRPLLVWVQTDAVEAKRRATKEYPKGSGLSADEFTSELKNFQAPGVQEKPIVISGKHTYATQLKIVLKQLASTTTRIDTPPDATGRPRARGMVLR